MRYDPPIDCLIYDDALMHRIVVLMTTARDSQGACEALSMKDGHMMATRLDAGMQIPPLLVFEGRSRSGLQAMADALAEFGIMPRNIDNTKELAATQRHLEDMRQMAMRAFNKVVAP